MANKVIYVDAIWEFTWDYEFRESLNKLMDNCVRKFNKVLIICHQNKDIKSDVYNSSVFTINDKVRSCLSNKGLSFLYKDNTYTELKSNDIKIKELDYPGYYTVRLHEKKLLLDYNSEEIEPFEKRLTNLEEKINKIYYAPDMPGYHESYEDFNNLQKQ